jgi:rubrerythrin
MATEPSRIIQVLKIAIQMEIDGKGYYLKLSRTSASEPGRELFRTLANEEDTHRLKFEEIHEAIRHEKGWPKISFDPDRANKLNTIFDEAVHKIGKPGTAPATEFDAVSTAMDMENRSFDLYYNQIHKAVDDTEREFYQALASEERGHYLSLLNYYEYLKDPAAWFVSQEHHSLDGG